jgi:hypothetical protein
MKNRRCGGARPVEGGGAWVALTGGGGRLRFKPAQLAPVPGWWTMGGGGGRRAPGAPRGPVGVDKGKHRGTRRRGTPRQRRKRRMGGIRLSAR